MMKNLNANLGLKHKASVHPSTSLLRSYAQGERGGEMLKPVRPERRPFGAEVEGWTSLRNSQPLLRKWLNFNRIALPCFWQGFAMTAIDERHCESPKEAKQSRHLSSFALVLLLIALPSPTSAVVQNISRSSQQDVVVTLYPKNMALVKERRKATFQEGSNKLLIKDVPSDIVEDSFIFEVIPPAPAIKLLEYHFQPSHITRDALLQHSLGEEVRILPSQLLPMPQTAKLIALDGEDCVLEAMGQVVVLKNNRIAFSRIPYTLASEPLITLKLMNPKEGEYDFNIGYLAKGFTWDAGYTIILNPKENKFDLNNWINIHNNSGMDIKKGHFLVSHTASMLDHFYDIEKPISLPDKAVKNVSWFAAKALNPTTSFRVFPKNNLTQNEENLVIKPVVEAWLSVENDKAQGLGIPLPQGTIKVFLRTENGFLVYVGENTTPFIPIGKPLSLRVGSTKTITAEMRQTDFRKLGNQVVESGYRLDLKNETSAPRNVTVFQDVRGEWTILRETHPHEEEEEGKQLHWSLTLKPHEEVSLRYRIRMNVE